MDNRFEVNAIIQGYCNKIFNEIINYDSDELADILKSFVKIPGLNFDHYYVEVEYVHLPKFFQAADVSTDNKIINLVHKITHHSTYFYLALQAKVDYMMPFRIEDYRVRTWAQYLEKNNITGDNINDRLPMFYSAVIYLDSDKWDADGTTPDATWSWYQVYTVINLSEQQLIQKKGIFCAMLYIVKSNNFNQFADRIINVVCEWNLEQRNLLRFVNFVYSLLDKDSNEHTVIINMLLEHNDVANMLNSVQNELLV